MSASPLSSIETVDDLGLPALQLRTAQGAQAVVSLYGGQVLSWSPPGDSGRLYLSPEASPRHGALRGGIPVCFPQFAGLGPLPKHGLVRTREWECVTQRHGDDYALVTLACAADESSLDLWPHDFRLELTIGIEATRLDLELEVINPGNAPFRFTGALHTYLRVGEVEDCRLEGLYGLAYRNAAAGDAACRETGEAVIVEDEVDRVYREVGKPMLLRDGGCSLGLRQENFPDTVVWNPWEHRAKALADLPDRDFRHFICVEAAVAEQPVEVGPGASWWGRQTLVAL